MRTPEQLKKQREYDRARYAADPERFRAKKRARRAEPEYAKREAEKACLYRAAHPERVHDTARRWRRAHPEQVREMDKRHHAASKTPEQVEQDRKRVERYRAAHPELGRERRTRWRRAHPEKERATRRHSYMAHPGEAYRRRRVRKSGILLTIKVVTAECGVCQRPLSNVPWPAPRSTTIGHEPPLSVAAREGWKVVVERPEHLVCNLTKGSRTDSEMIVPAAEAA